MASSQVPPECRDPNLLWHPEEASLTQSATIEPRLREEDNDEQLLSHVPETYGVPQARIQADEIFL